MIDDLSFVPKLPELIIESFTGDLTKWQSFIETFDNHVHRNARLSEITKFQYLKNFVKGSAANPSPNSKIWTLSVQTMKKREIYSLNGLIERILLSKNMSVRC